MPLIVSDELLQQLGMSADEARIGIACWLFHKKKLALWPAAQFAGLSRVEFEGELHQRRIPIYRLTIEDLKADLEALDQLERLRQQRD